MQKQITTLILFLSFSFANQAQEIKVIDLSQDMMTSFKMNQPVDELETQLANVSFETLTAQLNSDLRKQAFWANIYIVYSQKLLAEYGECEKGCRNQKVITVANRVFSLNDILYKILLHSKSKVTGGKRIFAPKWEKALRISYPDGRVLLAIDSHETIADAVTYYEPEKMDGQLNETAKIFLSTFVVYDLDKNTVYLPSWMKRFKREFGSKSGAIAGLKRAELIPKDMKDTQIVYSDKLVTSK